MGFKTKSKVEISKLDSVEKAGEMQKINRRRMLGLAVGTGVALAAGAGIRH
jgi:hypothetical protein